MHRFARLLMAAFLAFAVPVQGLAGVTMAACGAAHGGNAVSHHAMGHDHAAMAHDHAARVHDHADMTGTHAGAGEAHAAHNCAACAACCSLSAAPVPALLATAAGPAPSAAIPFLEGAHDSVAPRGLERPPSTLLVG